MPNRVPFTCISCGGNGTNTGRKNNVVSNFNDFVGNPHVNVNHSENQLNHVKTVNISKGTL